MNGRIAARSMVAVRSTVTGTLIAPLATEGDEVAVGDVLARLDPAGQDSMVRQAIAGLDAGLVALAQAEATARRDRALGANLARSVLEDAERAAQTAQQDVGRLIALVDHAQELLSHYTIVAPISGVVVTRGIEPGQVIDTATVLFTLADLTDLLVNADVDESYATQIRTGQRAVLQFVGETRTLPGKVDAVALQVDPATGGLEVEIAFDAPQQVPIGLTTTANIVVEERADALSVPRSAVLNDSTGVAVFVVDDGVARRREISVVDWPADRLIVAEGLEAEETVIVDATGITDGMAVVATTDPTAAEPSPVNGGLAGAS